MLIQCKNLVVGFVHKPLITIPDLILDNKRITLLTGANGCGKTTLLKTLSGWLSPLCGEMSPSDFSGLTYVPESPPLFAYLTVFEHFKLAAALCKETRFSPEVLLESLDLTSVREVYPQTLSSGLKKMVGLGCALIPQSSFVLLDEPTSMLDKPYRTAVYRILNQLHLNGIGVLFSSHGEEDKKLFSHKLLIDQKTLDWDASPLSQKVSKEAFA